MSGGRLYRVASIAKAKGEGVFGHLFLECLAIDRRWGCPLSHAASSVFIDQQKVKLFNRWCSVLSHTARSL